jgi:hypothetical protein
VAKHEVKAGQTDYTALVFLSDAAQTDGSGKTGLVAANLTVSYVRVETDNDVTVTDVTSSLNDLANLTATHADWGLFEVSNTLAPGLYRLDMADAVFATGAWSAVVYVMVTTSAASPSPMEFVMVPDVPLTGVNVSQLGGVTQSATDLKDLADTGYDPSTHKVAGVVLADTVTTNSDKTGYRLSSTGVDDLLRTALTEAYAADGAAPTLSQLLFLVLAALTEFSISSTTVTVKKLDGATTAATYTLDSDTAPTSRTRAS